MSTNNLKPAPFKSLSTLTLLGLAAMPGAAYAAGQDVERFD